MQTLCSQVSGRAVLLQLAAPPEHQLHEARLTNGKRLISNDPKNLWAYPWAHDVAQSWICQLQASITRFFIHAPKNKWLSGSSILFVAGSLTLQLMMNGVQT